MTNSVNIKPNSTKLNAPEFLLGMVIFFMLWAIGLVDLLTHTTDSPEYQFVGPYSRSIILVLVAYGGLFFAWLGALLVPGSHHWIRSLIAGIQSRIWLVLPILAGIVAIIWSIFRFKEWEKFPGLGLAIFGMVLFLGLVLVFAGWSSAGRGQFWRKLIAIPLGIFVVAEVLVQGAAYAGMLPPVSIHTGLYVPQGRIYQSQEGFANGFTNGAGWYYPEFELAEGTTKIMVMGDTFVQGLQVDSNQNLGVHLHELVQAATLVDSIKTEVFALGMPGFGPGLYLSETRMIDAIERFQPDEIILLFHLSNDFQVVNQPSEYELYYEVREDGVVDIHEEAWSNRHDLQHVILYGYGDGIAPLRTFASYILAPKLVTQLLTTNASAANAQVGDLDMPRFAGEVSGTRYVDEDHSDVTAYRVVPKPGTSNFLFDKSQSGQATEPYEIAFGLLRQTNEFLKAEGVSLRIATIPAFPPAFFNESTGTDWSPEIGPYDLFVPEKRLVEFAQSQEIEILPMGHFMQQSGLSVEEIQKLYFNNGQGHFTEAGHQYFGQSIFDCFMSGEQSAACRTE